MVLLSLFSSVLVNLFLCKLTNPIKFLRVCVSMNFLCCFMLHFSLCILFVRTQKTKYFSPYRTSHKPDIYILHHTIPYHIIPSLSPASSSCPCPCPRCCRCVFVLSSPLVVLLSSVCRVDVFCVLFNALPSTSTHPSQVTRITIMSIMCT